MTSPDAARCGRCGTRLARDNHTSRCDPCRASDRNHLAGAPDVPVEFWQFEPLQEALVARHMGRVIRAYRRHPFHGRHPLPQDVVAGWVGITQAQLSRIERGPVVVHLDRLIEWALVLHIPEPYLWFKLPHAAATPADETEGMKRRSFLGLASAGVLGSITPTVPSPPPGVPLGPPIAELSAALLTTHTSNDAPVAVAELTSQVTSAWRLRQRAHYEALSQLLPPLLRQARTSAAASSGADQQQAGRVVVHAYNAASSLLKKLGDGPLALLAADRAVQTARTLDDPVLVAAALFRLANVLLADQRSGDSRTVALQAADLIEPGKTRTPRTLSLWGSLLLTAAVAAARQGDASTAWELMGQARTARHLLGRDHADIYSIFGPTNLAIHGVQVAVELGDGRDAVRRSQHVSISELPPSLVERRGQFLIDVANGHLLSRDDEAAVAVLLQADELAPQEVRLSTQVHGLTRTMLGRERSGAVPALRDLASRIGLATSIMRA